VKHYTIPIFVPELACPNRCVFCNQHSISGCQRQPEPDKVREIILEHLKTIPEKDTHIEIGFFGGSFTGIENELQERYLAIADDFFIRKQIHGIRLSTRPDYIDDEVLNRLKRFGVTTIELGAQSLDEEVLRLSGRGHTISDVEKASELILSAGFKLGLQMMTGLPGDTVEKSIHTAKQIVELGAHCSRIYPTLVIRGTELADRWRKKEYQPQTLEEAVEISSKLLEIFRKGGVEVIRVGLHPSEGILDGSELLAGPFHPAFRELVETHRWKKKLLPLIDQQPKGSNIRILVPENELRFAIGHDSSNRKMLETHFDKVEFVVDDIQKSELPLIITDKRLPLPAKNTLKVIGNPLYLQTDGFVYKSISGHADIFMCMGDEGLVVAPGLPDEIKDKLSNAGIQIYTGHSNPGKVYPDSARYNAVVTPEYIIHNLKITNPAIFEAFPGRKHLHVNQGYTRCNLISLNDDIFITSDKGIEKVLIAEGKEVLYVDPQPIRLKGQKYGFFPGCCGVLNGELLISGSLSFHPDKERIEAFLRESGFRIRELYLGELTDVGGIFCFSNK
jgi:radical SAM superfamily enzyme